MCSPSCGGGVATSGLPPAILKPARTRLMSRPTPGILILDEATSALDYESERIIQDNMRDICRGRTVIIIAHRLSAVKDANRILVMDHGELIEEGHHGELKERPNGTYAKLYALQQA